jgi:hypothetical protein
MLDEAQVGGEQYRFPLSSRFSRSHVRSADSLLSADKGEKGGDQAAARCGRECKLWRTAAFFPSAAELARLDVGNSIVSRFHPVGGGSRPVTPFSRAGRPGHPIAIRYVTRYLGPQSEEIAA